MSQNQMSGARTQERHVNVKHLFFFLLKRWRSLIALILIGALAGGAYGYKKDGEPKYSPFAEGREADAQVYRELEWIYRNYKLVSEDAQRDYRIQLSEDEKYYTGVMTAYLEADDPKTVTLICDLMNFTKTDPCRDALAEIVGLEDGMDKATLDPILAYTYSSFWDGTSVKVFMDDKVAGEGRYALLSYTIHYVTSEQFDRVVGFARGELERRLAEYKAEPGFRYEIFNATKGEELLATTFTARRTSAQSNVDNLNKFLNLLGTVEKTTSPYNGSNLVKYFRSHAMAGVTEDDEPSNTRSNASLKKMLVLGAIGAVALWGVCWVLVYLFRDRIYTRLSVTEYGLLILGEAGSKSPKNPFDRFLAKLEGPELVNSEEYLAASLSRLKGDPVVICPVSGNEEDTALAEALCGKNGSLCICDVTRDAELFEKAGEDAAVVMLVHLGLTKGRDLTSAIQVCRLHGYNVLGAVLIAE